MVDVGDLAGGEDESIMWGMSGDGSLVTGISGSSGGYEAFSWTQATGMIGLGDPFATPFASFAEAASQDGSVIVGVAGDIGLGIVAGIAFRWTQSTGMVPVGELPGGYDYSEARAVTPDGTVIVGYSAVEGGYEAFRWTQGGGMVTLGDLPGGAIHGGASDVSADGLVIVGAGTTASGYEAFIWTQSGGMVGLGDLPGGPTVSGATACSDDGSVVVGAANYDQATDFGDAFIWTADRGMRYLKDEIIATRCVPEIAGYRLVAATGISGDGRVVVGNAINPDGDLEAFIIRLDAAPTPPPCRADFNGDHAVNSQDFFDFLAAFFAGC